MSVDVLLAPYVAVIVDVAVAEPARDVTGNVVVDAAWATVAVAGTVAADVFELERATTMPPAGAAPAKVIVPVAPCPPATVVGLRVRWLTAGFTVRDAVFAPP